MEARTADPNTPILQYSITPILHYSNAVHWIIHRSNLNRNIHAGGQVELLQLVHGLGGGIEDVEEALVGALLEGFLGFLVRVRRTQHREALDTSRQGDGSGDAGAGAFDGL